MIDTRTRRPARERAVVFGLLAVALVILSLLAAEPVHAVTLTVNSTADPGTGGCTSKECTLREAINVSNGLSTTDTITFAIPDNAGVPGLEVKTISPTFELPAITDRVTINGYTQPGSSENTATTNANSAVLKVELNGASAGAFSRGLLITGAEAAGTTIRGLVINRFGGSGVIADAGSAVVAGNFIGTNASGTADLGNDTDGVSVSSLGNLIGGQDNAAQNVISGNDRNGVSVLGSTSTDNVVSNNHIGTDADAAEDLGNTGSGVQVVRAPGVLVGGEDAGGSSGAGHDNGTVRGEGNIISGNGGHGVVVDDTPAEGTKIFGNLIGLNRNGNGFSNIGNALAGVKIQNTPRVEVGGTQAGQGNTISDNGEYGVEVFGATAANNKVQGNHIGTDFNGSSDFGNALDGVLIGSSASGTTVGGIGAGARNVISGNDRDGVEMFAGVAGTLVRGNFIGTDANGSSDLGNTDVGVFVRSPGNVVGGEESGTRNVISGNGLHGVLIAGSAATGNEVRGNFIGTDRNAVADLGNTSDGVVIANAPGNVVGGSTVGARNVISGNDQDGVRILGLDASENQVSGNFVGTDRDGTADLGNSGNGVVVEDTSGNTVGGTLPGAGNVVSGNDGSGVSIFGAGSSANRVQGNLIGTDARGTADLGNAFDGVKVDDASGNTIGGTEAGARNTISGNGRNGVNLDDAGTEGNRIEGNFIGTRSDGTGDVGNASDGVRIDGGSGNFVGGTVAGARNVISGNDGHGVLVAGLAAAGNRILRNSIFSNTGLGINLSGGTENAQGATANDPQDPDEGPNTLQNKPALRSATTDASSLTVQGNLNSTPVRTFTIQFFSNPSGNEGETFVGQRSVTTNANGNASFAFTFDISVAAGQTITATATRVGNTSEFSAPRTVVAP